MKEDVIQQLRQGGLIGVVPPHEASGLKRHVLLCRKVILPGWEAMIREVELLHGPQVAGELEWLRDEQVLLDLLPSDIAPRLDDREIPEEIEEHRYSLWQLITQIRDLVNRPIKGADSPEADPNAAVAAGVEQLMRLAQDRNSSLARYVGALLRLVDVSAVPLISQWKDKPAANVRLGTVAHVVIDNLPIPDDGTSWQQVLEFRDDARVQQHYTSMRMWITRAANGETSPRDLAGEIEASTRRYEGFLREYRLGQRQGTWHSVIRGAVVGSSVAEVGTKEVGAIVGAIGSILVTVLQQRSELLRAEMTAPGAELAYIVKARERFGK